MSHANPVLSYLFNALIERGHICHSTRPQEDTTFMYDVYVKNRFRYIEGTLWKGKNWFSSKELMKNRLYDYHYQTKP